MIYSNKELCSDKKEPVAWLIGERGRVRRPCLIYGSEGYKVQGTPIGRIPAGGLYHGTVFPSYDGKLTVTDAPTDKITMILSSYGVYARNTIGQIHILRRFALDESDFCYSRVIKTIVGLTAEGKEKDAESVSHVKILGIGVGAIGDAGNLGRWVAGVFNVSMDTIFRVRYTGYSEKIEYFIVTEGRVDVVDKNGITAYFGGNKPWETEGERDWKCISGTQEAN